MNQAVMSLPFETTGVDVEIVASDLRVRGASTQLSRTGMSIVSDEPMTVSSTCEIYVSLVFAEGHSSERLPLRGSVVWCTPLGDRFQLGIQFVRPEGEIAGHLDLFVGLLAELEPSTRFARI